MCIRDSFPIVALLPADEARESMLSTIKQLRVLGAKLIPFDNQDYTGINHPLLAPLVMLQDSYRHIEVAARLRGLDPDKPAHLSKVTLTV